MKKSFLRIISSTLAAAALCACLSVGAGAELKLEARSINVSTGIRISLNGSEFVPLDSEGAPVEVFLYNGTTYLPIRAISGIFGLGVDWDNESKTVYLGTRDGAELPAAAAASGNGASPFAFAGRSINVFTGAAIRYNGELFVPTGSDGEVVDVLLYNGSTYLPVRAISGLMNAAIDWDQASRTVLLNTERGSEEAAAAAGIAKSYTDMGQVLLAQYQYYLQVSAVLEGYAQELKAAYLLDPTNAESEYALMQFMNGYEAFNKQFGTCIEKAMDLYEFAKTLSVRVDAWAQGGYSAEELETLSTNAGYLRENLPYYSEYVQNTTAERILLFVRENFDSTVLGLVGALS